MTKNQKKLFQKWKAKAASRAMVARLLRSLRASNNSVLGKSLRLWSLLDLVIEPLMTMIMLVMMVRILLSSVLWSSSLLWSLSFLAGGAIIIMRMIRMVESDLDLVPLEKMSFQ